jgi:hypothetical protein
MAPLDPTRQPKKRFACSDLERHLFHFGSRPTVMAFTPHSLAPAHSPQICRSHRKPYGNTRGKMLQATRQEALIGIFQSSMETTQRVSLNLS